ncbi:hypothetical protein GA0070616_4326 [Micromonospora nigra]|uniref:Uncharacterized protein n=1 Tax=Micromonospora nigra TaxID=145857 RepID=A0A1C6SR37_9ACTN|nr:hypothetical protein [Micromonospora nigra]SCL31759.1 hypothetical protein GA0070616_4326 [Micromonospora nigra]
MPTVARELFVHHLESWLPTAAARVRRAAVALAYAEPVDDAAEAALREVARHAGRLRGCRLTVLVLAGDADLPARLGAVEATLPAEVTVHLVPGDAARLPVALKAAGAAGAPLLSYVEVAGGAAPVWAAAATGRPAELLVAARPAEPPVATGLSDAGFPLVGEVLVGGDAGPARRIALATGSDRSLERFKETLWTLDVVLRDPTGRPLPVVPEPDLAPLGAELLAELARSGPRTLTELRRHALTATAYRSTDAARAVTALLDRGTVTRDPAHGRLGGDVLIAAAR